VVGTVGVPGSRSPFTLHRPPPERAPRGVAATIGWELAAYLWRAHTPNSLSGNHCAQCGLGMPCPCWRFADAFLADLLSPLMEPTVRPVEEPTQPLQ
jgi:hypothetical protein